MSKRKQVINKTGTLFQVEMEYKGNILDFHVFNYNTVQNMEHRN